MTVLTDLTGLRFGRLVARSLTKGTANRGAWLCRCVCGKEVRVAAANLRSGNTTSCGCAKIHEMPGYDLANQRFGRLLALAPVRIVKNSRAAWFWICKCDCGAARQVRASTLRNGASTSCGCRAASVTAERNRTHGRSGTRLHRIWKGMLTRCRNPEAKDYPRYGGRGIKVCERWNSFENFLADMGEPPTPKHSIDRAENSGNYEKNNCEWATSQTQARHTRRSHMITIGTETLPLVIWCERYSSDAFLVRDRLRRDWEPLRALTEPPRPTGR